MIVSQNMVAEAEVICKPNVPVLDVKYHLCVSQETQIESSPTSPVIQVAESISTEISRFETVRLIFLLFLELYFWEKYLPFVCCLICVDLHRLCESNCWFSLNFTRFHFWDF